MDRLFDHDLRRFADNVRLAADRDDAFWHRQREAISLRLEPRQQRHKTLAWTAASAVTALLVAGFLVLFGPGAHGPSVPQVAEVDPDDQLIAEIEVAVAQELPSALEPAGDLFW